MAEAAQQNQTLSLRISEAYGSGCRRPKLRAPEGRERLDFGDRQTVARKARKERLEVVELPEHDHCYLTPLPSPTTTDAVSKYPACGINAAQQESPVWPAGIPFRVLTIPLAC